MPAPSSNTNSNTSTTTTQTSTVAAPQKPKLTGWAQAAARAIPKQQQKDQAQTKNTSTSTDTPQSAKNPTTPASGNNNNSNDPNKTSTSSTATNTPTAVAHDALSRHPSNRDSMSANTPTNKRPQRQPYNREEVKTYMNKLFEKYSSEPTLRSYREIFENRNNLSGTDGNDWGVVTGRGGRHRNRRYGCLSEVAKVLKN